MYDCGEKDCGHCAPQRARELEARVTELQNTGREHLEAARAARRERDRARFEADVWSGRALEAWASLRRIDPSYSQEESS